ncbi:CDGSH iron-sulfur domain-containing protein [Nocardioides aestuarii]|uniref:CDGSH iron-sulfur domain-containing protein n=1 Tax=Nocardioides aestuarii TaxID=252231 RepID=A0ABW4TQU9_9ACTN
MSEEEHPDVIVCPGGPLLLRGDHVVEDADGKRHRTSRSVSAVCRCGATGAPPWCDGTHQQFPRDRRP